MPTESSRSHPLDSALFSKSDTRKMGMGVDDLVDTHALVHTNRPPHPFASHLLADLHQRTQTSRFAYFTMARCIWANPSASSADFV